MYEKYKLKSEFPFKREITNFQFEPETLNLIICFKFEFRKYKGKSLVNLEQQATVKLNKTLERIYLTVLNRKIDVNWRMLPKILFLTIDHQFLGCFQIVIDPKRSYKLPRYQSLLSVTKLNIEIKSTQSSYSLYILPNEQTFSEKALLYYPTGHVKDFYKKVVRRSKLSKRENCTDYNELNQKCLSQSDCLNRCRNQVFLKRYSNLSSKSIIDKDEFSEHEWSTLFISDDQMENDIDNICRKQFPFKECSEAYYVANQNIGEVVGNIHQIDLSYKTVSQIDEEPSSYKLVLEMFNVQSIFFGLNLLKIFAILNCLVKTKLKLNESKIVQLLIYFGCLLGFAYQSYAILDEIISGKFTFSQHFEYSDSIDMPDIVFCVDFNQTLVDANHKLTGNYLNELTNHLTLHSVFKNVSYLNEFNQWIDLDLKSLESLESNSPTRSNSEFRTKMFYFFDKKCFLFRIELRYELSQFYFSDNSKVLRFVVDRLFIGRQNEICIFTKIRDTLHFSRFLFFRFDFAYNLITQGLFEVVMKDIFNFIKHPLSLFYEEHDLNDLDKYMHKKSNEIQNSSTLNLPVKGSRFETEINDEIFKQFSIQEVTNFKRNFFETSVMSKSMVTSDQIFEFELLFSKRKLKIKNEDSYTKFLLNLLNVLTFWLNLGILEIIIFSFKIFKIKSIFIFMFRCLVECKRKLSNNFHHNRVQCTQTRIIEI